MGSYTIIAIIFVVIGAVVLIAVTRSRSSGGSHPVISGSAPVYEPPKPVPPPKPYELPRPEPESPAARPPVTEDSSSKWIHTKAKEKFVPQDTVYEFRRMAPCILCPFCDAENEVGSSSCQVCGTSFRRGV